MKLWAKIPGALLALGLSAALNHNALAGADNVTAPGGTPERRAFAC
jgi:hypothetical protein